MEIITCSANNEAKLEYASANSGPYLMESFSKVMASSFFSWDLQIIRVEKEYLLIKLCLNPLIRL